MIMALIRGALGVKICQHLWGEKCGVEKREVRETDRQTDRQTGRQKEGMYPKIKMTRTENF